MNISTALERLTLALFVYMPFHLFLSRWLSTYTGGLMVWEVGKDIITLLGLALAGYMFMQKKLYNNKYLLGLTVVIALYGILHLIFLADSGLDRRAAVMGTLYNLRFFAWLFIGFVVGADMPKDFIGRCLKIVLIVSTIVAIFGILQYFLPKDLMEHFGYSVERGAKPVFYIDDKPDFPRIMSTIRDPNSLGAYLVLPITLLWLRVMSRTGKLRYKYVGLLAVQVLALLLTFSRSALIGMIISLFLATVISQRKILISFIKKYRLLLAIGVVGIVAASMAVYNTYAFQNIVLHSDQQTVMADPNETRIQVQSLAIKEIFMYPLGHAPGTSGLISISNTKGGLITENYFLQIGFETGFLGLGLYVVLLGLAYAVLLKVRESEARTVLLSSFWGYAFIGLLIHIWSNEAVALQFWLLAGLVAANITTQPGDKNSYNKKTSVAKTTEKLSKRSRPAL